MKPIKEYKVSSLIIKEYEEGVILQKGKDVIFINSEHAEAILETFNQLKLISQE